jgi:hypothetical protein
MAAKIISIMQDDLEKFVNNNREAFDAKAPSFDLWENIEKELNQKKEEKVLPFSVVKSERSSFRRQIMRYGSIAAVGLLLLTVGGVIGSQWFGANNTGSVADTEISLSDVSDEYAETEAFYAQKVNASISELKKRSSDNSILEDIEELDAAFQELKKELGQSNAFSNEEIVQAMIENYQMKIEILERVLERLPNENNSGKATKKEKSNEKANI